MFGILDDYTLQIVALGSAVLGITSGVLGTFAVLRRQSLLGDAISHAALPGIAIAFLLTGSKAPIVLLLGAALAGWLGAVAVASITHRTRIKQDTALGLVLSVFFGVGLVLLTYIQRLPDAGKAGLDTFLFGQAAAMLQRDVVTMAILGGIAVLMVGVFWKEFKLLAFDPGFASSIGLKVRTLELLITSLLVVAIVIGLQTVGVVLMSAMVVAPAAAARQWTDRLALMVLLAAGFGAVSGVTGAVLSSNVSRLPTGPTIVLVISAIVGISFAFAPRRGLVVGSLRRRRSHHRLRAEVLLADLYLLSLQHPNREHGHDVAAIAALRPGIDCEGNLRTLEARGLVNCKPDGTWLLTEQGEREGRRLTATAAEAIPRALVEGGGR